MLVRSRSVLKKTLLSYQKSIRTFLSDEFKCQESWNSRLNSDLMQKVNLDSMYYQIKQSIQKQGKPSAIDVDIFVNKLTAADKNLVIETVDLVNQLRLSEETTNTLDSTHHATVRNLMDMDLTEQLISVLDNRLEYGIFLDTYTALYLLNHLVLRKDFSSAAKVSTLLMLQDDLENEMVQSFALYACYKHLNAFPFEAPAPAETVETEPTEVKKVRVKYLRNEFFDDHFDEKNIERLLGKTFLSISATIKKRFAASCKLIGFTLCQKYEDALEELKKPVNTFYKEILRHCLTILNHNKSEDPSAELLKSALQNIATPSEKLESGIFDEDIVELIQSTVKSQEGIEINKQLEAYRNWNVLRDRKLDEELQRIEKVEKLKEIEKIAADMKLEEQKLWFFDNETQIDLEIDNEKLKNRTRSPGSQKKLKTDDSDYVPPEIIKHRSS